MPSDSKVMHRQRRIIVLATVAIGLAAACTVSSVALTQQEPAVSQGASPAASGSSSAAKHSHANDLLIRGTVFNERGLSMEGVKLRIQRAGARKPHWETFSNFRGEFAVRVPQGADYEIAAENKGFTRQSQAVDGKTGVAEEKVIFHLEPLKGGKP